MNKIKLENLNRITFEIDYQPIVDKYAEDCANGLKRTSPKGRRRRDNYANGWTTEKKNQKKKYGAVVWNSTNWQLTHLLENGHLIVNKKGGVGWASAKPHIQKAFKQIEPRFVEAMKNANIKTKFQ